ncbi:Auxin-induced protein 5NG4 [Hordeum vulgare]|nr:Auxin-induced protein 5NG4 [Hordeum vulgare]
MLHPTGTMQYVSQTFLVLNTMLEREYPAGDMVENELRVWAISRLRGAMEFATVFIRVGYHHLPRGSLLMFTSREARMGGSGLIVHFTNLFDAYHLLIQAFFCGCEFIVFSTYNIFTNLDYTFPTLGHMHSFCYHFPEPEDEE